MLLLSFIINITVKTDIVMCFWWVLDGVLILVIITAGNNGVCACVRGGGGIVANHLFPQGTSVPQFYSDACEDVSLEIVPWSNVCYSFSLLFPTVVSMLARY